MDEVYDMELYEWTKVDISDEAQKERVSQMIEDAEPFEGEALLDAKCFKWKVNWFGLTISFVMICYESVRLYVWSDPVLKTRVCGLSNTC